MSTKLNDDYYLRKFFLLNNDVPCISLMEEKMCKRLANIHFQFMSNKSRVLSGLCPVLKGPGEEVWISPKDVLDGNIRTTASPQKNYFKNYNWKGIVSLGTKLAIKREKCFEEARYKRIKKEDNRFARIIQKNADANCQREKESEYHLFKKSLKQAMKEYEVLFKTSLSEIEDNLRSNSVDVIIKVKTDTLKYMKQDIEVCLSKLKHLLEIHYIKHLKIEKNKLKTKFLDNLRNERKLLCKQINQIHTDHIEARKKLRHQQECINKACRMYVTCTESMRYHDYRMEMQKNHEETMQELRQESLQKDLQIDDFHEKVQQINRHNSIWQTNVCKIVKQLQLFITSCLNMIPQQAEFFINIEKLMIMQLNNVLNEVPGSSVLEEEVPETNHTSETLSTTSYVPEKEPFMLYGDFKNQNIYDKSYFLNLSKNIDHPVIVVNNRHLYAECKGYTQPYEPCDCFKCTISHDSWMSQESNEKNKVSDILQSLDEQDFFQTTKTFDPDSMYYKILASKRHIKCGKLEENMKVLVNNLIPETENKSALSRKNIIEYHKMSEACNDKCMYKTLRTYRYIIPAYMEENLDANTLKELNYKPCTRYDIETLIRDQQKVKEKNKGNEMKSQRWNNTGIQCELERLKSCICIPKVLIANRSDSVDKFTCHLPSDDLNDTVSEFAMKRAKSLQNLFKNHPSLRTIFDFERPCNSISS